MRHIGLMLYRFQIELSDIDRGVYESLDFRVAQHPSETYPYMLSRVFAYCLAYQERLEFTPGGLADPEAPALRKLGLRGDVETWIEIGNPSARKLHKASKTAQEVMIFTYKNPEVLLTEIRNNDVHRANELQIYSFSGDFLTAVSESTDKNNRWTLLVQQGQMDLTVGEQTFSGEIRKFNI
jgi:uncharacterized protein YaeQ